MDPLVAPHAQGEPDGLYYKIDAQHKQHNKGRPTKNDAGKVSEGPGSCFFMVTKGVLVTPMLTDSVLESITRDTVIQLAKMLGIPVQERTVDRTELYACEEAFLCGSAMEITPVLSVDRYTVGDGTAGEMTRRLHKAYLDAAMGKDERFASWITPIYE